MQKRPLSWYSDQLVDGPLELHMIRGAEFRIGKNVLCDDENIVEQTVPTVPPYSPLSKFFGAAM